MPSPAPEQRRDAFFTALDSRRGRLTWTEVAERVGLRGGDGSIRSLRSGKTRLTRERVIGLAEAVGSRPEDLWEGWPDTAPEPNKRAPRAGKKSTPYELLAERVARIEATLEREGILPAPGSGSLAGALASVELAADATAQQLERPDAQPAPKRRARRQ